MEYLKLKEYLLENIKGQEYYFHSMQVEVIINAEVLLREQSSTTSTEFASILRERITLNDRSHFLLGLLNLIESYENNTPFTQPENQYLLLLRKEQQLRKESRELRNELDLVSTVCNNRDRINKYLREGESISTITSLSNPRYQELIIKEKATSNSWWELRQKLNPGNLRFVVAALIYGEGLTIKEFGMKIGYSEEVIRKLIQEGQTSMELLDTICSYFKIEKTEEFLLYVD
ncbi:hypothetical protein [Bacillus sp. FJAT-29937]|uniref:hypothetical protein n=1 Tax=Bacillus sp. FJAT-29937 TaxID=1720553 RepID=UPI00082C844C|nr:hypothetical protein [Bacillus sp. FJAT-29937]